MGKETGIQWTDHTFNPWWGCVKVSAGCANCYANTFDKRVGGNHWGPNSERRFFGEKHWAQPLQWNKEAEQAGTRKKVFCASMADVFEELDDSLCGAPSYDKMEQARHKLFNGLIPSTPYLDWQLLTKRPQNIMRNVPRWWKTDWPKNAWIGTSVENQQAADERIPHLLKVPAAVRFLSCEPLLGMVELQHYLEPFHAFDPMLNRNPSNINWAIFGGESGPRARDCEIEWIRSGVQQCQAAGVAAFVKQLGGVRDKRHNIEEFPEDLQVREFPKMAVNA